MTVCKSNSEKKIRSQLMIRKKNVSVINVQSCCIVYFDVLNYLSTLYL